MAPSSHTRRTYPSVTLLVAGKGEILDARGDLHGVLPLPGATVLWEALGVRALAPLLRLALLRTRAGAVVELDVAADSADGTGTLPREAPAQPTRVALRLAPAGAGCSLVTALRCGPALALVAPGSAMPARATGRVPGAGAGPGPGPAGDAPQLVCSWCARVLDRHSRRWLELEDALRVPELDAALRGELSHGMCPRCADAVRDA